MKQKELEPIGHVAVGDVPERYDVLALFGDIENADDSLIHDDEPFMVFPPAPQKEKANWERTLDWTKREFRRIKLPPSSVARKNSATSVYRMSWALQLEQIRTLTRAKNVCLHLVDSKRYKLVPELWFGDWEDKKKPRVFSYGYGIAGYTWKRKEIYVSEGNVQDDPNFDPSNRLRSQKVRAILCTPIFNLEEDIIGVLSLDSYIEDRFNKQLKERIMRLQAQAYMKLHELDMPVTNDELIMFFFWLFQKAISHNYDFAKKTTEENTLGEKHEVYNKGMGERDTHIPSEKDSQWLDPQHVTQIFQTIHNELGPAPGKPGPPPVRLTRLQSIFQGRENEAIPLDEFEQAFADSKEPRKSAASAISWLNNTFKRWGFDLEIETNYYTTYRLRRRCR